MDKICSVQKLTGRAKTFRGAILPHSPCISVSPPSSYLHILPLTWPLPSQLTPDLSPDLSPLPWPLTSPLQVSSAPAANLARWAADQVLQSQGRNAPKLWSSVYWSLTIEHFPPLGGPCLLETQCRHHSLYLLQTEVMITACTSCKQK